MSPRSVLNRLLLVGSLAACLLGLLVTPSSAADGEPPVPRPGHPWFGPQLDVESPGPLTRYVERIRASPSSFTLPVDYPVSDDDTRYLDRQLAAAAGLGAVVVVDLQPRVPLPRTTTADARALAEVLQDAHDRLGLWFLARFAPEMNGSWERWGQQPAAYRAAFRRWAAVLHAEAPAARTVWSPVYGSGYPFLQQAGADGDLDLSRTRDRRAMDTDGDGRLTQADDPYGPYYPGDDAVDWVGLTLYRLGQDQGLRRNTLPAPGEVRARLSERFGYGDAAGRASFYERFAAGRGKPMVLQTAALWNPSVPGASDLTVKKSWWRQVFGALPRHPLIGVVSWLEVTRVEPEVADVAVTWRVTARPEVLRPFRKALRRSSVDLGPVSQPVQVAGTGAGSPGSAGGPPAGAAPEAAAPRVGVGPAGPDVPPLPPAQAWPRGTAATSGVALLLLVVAWAARRRRPEWAAAPTPAGERDGRWDVVRGVLVLAAVVGGSVQLLRGRDDAALLAGAVPVVGCLLLLAGFLRGRDHSALVRRVGASGAFTVRLRRAATIYAAAVAAALATWFLAMVPGAELDRLGLAQAGDDVRNLFPHADRLLDYPTPETAVVPVLTLQAGPWLTSALGLFVLAACVATPVLALLRRGLWWLVLPLSWASWALAGGPGLHLGPRWDADLLPAQAADSFPLLAWQLVLVHGLALGHHRARLARLVERRAVRATLTGLLATAVAAHAAGVALWATGRLDLDRWWSGPALPPGQLATLVLVAAAGTAVVTTCWAPLRTALRPVGAVGRRPLTTLLVHLAVLLAWVNGPSSLLVAVPGVLLVAVLVVARRAAARSTTPALS